MIWNRKKILSSLDEDWFLSSAKRFLSLPECLGMRMCAWTWIEEPTKHGGCLIIWIRKPNWKKIRSKRWSQGGIFILVSTEKIERERILPMYYTRQAIEQTFDISKNYAGLLPLRIQSDENLRGHLLITFIATVIIKRIQYRLIHEQGKRDKNLNPISLLQNLGYQHCSVYENKIIVQEANEKANQGYRIFGMESPVSISV